MLSFASLLTEGVVGDPHDQYATPTTVGSMGERERERREGRKEKVCSPSDVQLDEIMLNSSQIGME